AARTAGTRAAEAAATTTAEAAGTWSPEPTAATTGPRTTEAAAARSGTAETPSGRTHARRSIFPRARFAERQVAALERLGVELVDDLLRDGALGEFDKGEPA